MRYDIRLAIDYDYIFAVKDARHILRVAPRQDRGQMLHSFALKLQPHPTEHAVETCFFDNRTEHLMLLGAHSQLSVEMLARLTVDRSVPDLSDTPDPLVLARTVLDVRETDGNSPLHFLSASRMVAPFEKAGKFVRDCGESGTTGDLALAVAQHIQRDFAYEPGFSTIHTCVAETLSTKRGVCQDFAHLMIAGLREVGIPAAYVSGFLRTDPPPGAARIEGVDAMHAWVEVWLGPQFGWVGFDPTNGCPAGNGHIVVAIGRDYADVAPVDGVLTTTGPQIARHGVDVVPENEPQAAWQMQL
ncbi:transglutaminase family protein [Aureimonas fodinaquatilis]|uniref:Transglutaminase family protein n=2 Tax=Aureimonas fodinaquatilis TaxID=2565783 RepID=A0A5B0DRF7_9HYPH|nr:transglutaminase family protein [Aureimonas fodinaquatilis]